VLTLPGSNGNEATYATPMLLAFEAGVLLLGVALIAAPKLGAPSHHHGAALGTAAGFLFGLSDVAIKALTHVDGGPLAMLASPWLVFAAVGGVLAFLSSARGFQAGDARSRVGAWLVLLATSRQKRLLRMGPASVAPRVRGRRGVIASVANRSSGVGTA
jgi:hypothetical protein